MRTKFVMLATKYKGLKLLLLRRTLPELRENHLQPLLATLNGVAVYREYDKAFLFPNGSRLKLGYCDSENDIYQYQGQEYDVIGLEEATHFTEAQAQFITTCNRTTRKDFSPRMYYTCNPGNVGHAWVKRLFIDRDYREGENPDDYAFIQALITDNYVLMQRDPGYLRVLEALPEQQRRAHLYGDWDALEGQFFAEFRRHKHVIEPFEIPAHWRRFRSIDWGYNDPCCVLWHATDEDGHVCTYRELYVRETLAADVAKKIVAMTGDEKIAYTVASPDMWQKRGRRDIDGESIADSFIYNGVPLLQADNSRVIGWQRVREYLADAPDGQPYWQTFDTCKNLIRTLPELIYDTNNPEDVADGIEDHACLTGDTLIMTSEGKIPIKDLVGRTGKVYCHEGISTFRDVRKTRENAEIYEVVTEHGTFKGTGDHRVLTLDSWKQIQELTDADCIVRVNAKPGRLLSVKKAGRADVYNMEVDDYHNYAIDGGLIVHNCESLRYALMSRPSRSKPPKIIKPKPYDPLSDDKPLKGGFFSK